MRWFIVTMVLCLWSVGAHAQEQFQCVTPDEMETSLRDKYKEQVMFRGISAQGLMMVEVWANPNHETFSLVYTYERNGAMKSCLIGAGSDWQTIEFKEVDLGDPS
jgi:hypothetical protein